MRNAKNHLNCVRIKKLKSYDPPKLTISLLYGLSRFYLVIWLRFYGSLKILLVFVLFSANLKMDGVTWKVIEKLWFFGILITIVDTTYISSTATHCILCISWNTLHWPFPSMTAVTLRPPTVSQGSSSGLPPSAMKKYNKNAH